MAFRTEEIKVEFFKNGTAQVSISGVKGPACSDVTRKINDALGLVEKTENTSEYYEDPQESIVTK